MPIAQRPKKRLIAVHYCVPDMVAAAFEIALDAKREGVEPTIVDVSRLSHHHRWNADLFVNSLLNRVDPWSRAGRLERLCAMNGIEFHKSPASDLDGYQRAAERIVEELPEDFGHLSTDPGEFGILGMALAGWVATMVAADSQPTIRRYERSAVRAVEQFLATKSVFAERLQTDASETEVVVWNGRLPKYAGPWVAAVEAGAMVRFYENSGDKPTSYFFEEFTPFDRMKAQAAAQAEYRAQDSPEIRAWIQDWLEARQSNSQLNPFLSIAADTVSDAGGKPGEGVPSRSMDQNQRVVVLFTSSPDELVSVPGDWNTGDWGSQEEAFSYTASALAKKGYSVVVRLHPNIVTKSWREYRGQVQAFSGPSMTTILPTDPVDSYSLVRHSAAVMVWASTIGLESIAMGKPTYVLGAALYDEISDVRKLTGPIEVDALDGLDFSPRPESAYPAAYWQANEQARHPLSAKSLALSRAMHLRNSRYRLVFKIARAPRIIYLPEDLIQSPRPWMRLGYSIIGKQRTRRLMSVATRRYLMGKNRRE